MCMIWNFDRDHFTLKRHCHRFRKCQIGNDGLTKFGISIRIRIRFLSRIVTNKVEKVRNSFHHSY